MFCKDLITETKNLKKIILHIKVKIENIQQILTPKT